jgi:kynurenine formamidase
MSSGPPGSQADPNGLTFAQDRLGGNVHGNADSHVDAAPSVAAGVDLPVHVLAINALGLHLLDYLQFEDLVPLCAAVGRWSFFCVIAPLRLPHGTGSPVNPIAIV